MESMAQPQSENSNKSFESSSEKSELMQIFEQMVHDSDWAYRDLLKAIKDAEPGEA
jgi:hypothetical protein